MENCALDECTGAWNKGAPYEYARSGVTRWSLLLWDDEVVRYTCIPFTRLKEKLTFVNIGVSRCFHLELYPSTSTKLGIAVDVFESLIVKLRDCFLAKSCSPDNAVALVLNRLKRRLV